ncbi:MAG TPA: hypothetical protein V6C64_01150 [Microcoleaceae cyanobacterium]
MKSRLMLEQRAKLKIHARQIERFGETDIVAYDLALQVVQGKLTKSELVIALESAIEE